MPEIDERLIEQDPEAPSIPGINPVESGMQGLHGKLLETLDEDSGLNRDKIHESIPEPERAQEFIEFAEALLPNLPSEEAKAFAEDPIHFCSGKVSFRGLTPEKYATLKQTRTYLPQSGQFGSIAVFLSNSPYQAFSYQKKGTVAVIPVRNLTTLGPDSMLTVGSPEYKRHTEARKMALSPDLTKEERTNALYTLDDDLDLIEPSFFNKKSGEVTLVLRSAQPIETTQVFLTWDGSRFIEESVNGSEMQAIL